MPFTTLPRPRVVATGPACRAVVATRIDTPGLVNQVLRALRFAWFTTNLLLDEKRDLAKIVGEAIVARIDDPDVTEAYEADRAEARSAERSPAAAQRKTATTDGPERYTAPTLVFGDRFVAGGFQPLDAYEVLLVNAEPALERRPPPDQALEALEPFPEGLTTRELAVLLAQPGSDPDDIGVLAALIEETDRGRVQQTPMGDGVLWTTRRARRFAREGVRSAIELDERAPAR
jgi:hypothetical protein